VPAALSGTQKADTFQTWSINWTYIYCNCHLCMCSDKTIVNRYLLSVLVRLFLEKLEQSLQKFVADFSQLTVSDEKVNVCRLLICYLIEFSEIKVWAKRLSWMLKTVPKCFLCYITAKCWTNTFKQIFFLEFLFGRGFSQWYKMMLN